MLSCHVIRSYSVCQTKLHANVHFFISFSDVGLLVFICVCWAFDWVRQRKERFFSWIYFFVCFSLILVKSVVFGHGIPLSIFNTYLLFPLIFPSPLHLSMLILVFPTSFFHPEILLPKWGKGVAFDTSPLVLWYAIHPQVLFVCSCTVWSIFWIHKRDSGCPVGCVVRPRWILTCFGILVCLLGNQAYTYFFHSFIF